MTTTARPVPVYTPHVTRPARYPALDGLRGLAVLAVVLLHTGLLSWGWIGVDVFFALSGFLITGILLDAKSAGGTGWATYGKPFYVRRALRILPLAYATLALVFVVWPHVGLSDPTNRREQVWYWLFVSNWWPWARSEASWAVSHLWSLSVEEQFYLVWPWVVLAVSRKRLARVAVALMVLAPLVRVGLTFLPPMVGHTAETITLARLDGLAAGSLVAIWSREGRLRGGWWVVVAVCAELFALSLHLPEAMSYVVRYSLLGVGAGAAVAWLVVSEGPAFLRWPGLRWLGTVSYGVYVMHPFVIHWITAHRGTQGWHLFVLTACLTLPLAALSWYGAERPIQRLKRFWALPT